MFKKRINKKGVIAEAGVFTFFVTLLVTIIVAIIITKLYSDKTGLIWGIIVLVIGLSIAFILKVIADKH